MPGLLCVLSLASLAGYTARSGERSSDAHSAVLRRADYALAAAMLYVDDDNTTGTEQGTTAFPFNTIQEAVDAANAGDIINIAAGTYAENIHVRDKAVHLMGGFVGGSNADYAGGAGGDFSNRAPAANTTHIEGDGTDAAVSLIYADDSTLDGLRITGGAGSVEGLPWAAYGGGVYIEGGAPTLANNIIEQNDSRRGDVANIDDTQGGGVFATDADVTLVDNIIRDNTSGRGAGLALFGGSVIVRRNTVERNVALSDHGGGLEIGAPTAEITHNLIRENEVGRDLGYGWGGGISFFNPGNFATLSYNVVTGNYAPTAGAGVFIDDGAEAVLEHELIYSNACPEIGGAGVYVDGGEGVRSRATLRHMTVADHDCPDNQGGNGILLDVLSDATVTNSIFWGNGGDDVEVISGSTLSVTYTDAEEVVSGVGNLSADPLFADPGAGDYHLRSSGGRWDPAGSTWTTDTNDSSAIDAGDPASSFADESAPHGDRANLGAYGNTAEASRSPRATTRVPGTAVPQDFVLAPNYPNPFNPATLIRYTLPEYADVQVAIYSPAGRHIRTLASGVHQAGVYAVRWDGKDAFGRAVASGVYIYRVRAGSFLQARTMVLLR